MQQPDVHEPPPVIPYSKPGTPPRHSILLFLCGLVSPFIYLAVAPFVIMGLSDGSTIYEAVEAFEPAVIAVIALFPVAVGAVWWITRRGIFVLGVLAGTIGAPVFGFLVWMIAVRRGV